MPRRSQSSDRVSVCAPALRKRQFWSPLVLAFFASNALGQANKPMPRYMPPKPDAVAKPNKDCKIDIKFVDDMEITVIGGQLRSRKIDLRPVNQIAVRFGLQFEPAVPVPSAQLAKSRAEAEMNSGIKQPDFDSMIYAYGAQDVLEQATNALLALPHTEQVSFASLSEPSLPCNDILPPVTPDYYTPTMFSLFDYHGPDPGINMNAAWARDAQGQNVAVVDVEKSYIIDHEDLCGIGGDDNFSPEALVSSNHGTMTLGVLGASQNTYGWSGLLPDAVIGFSSIFAPGSPGWNINTGIMDAEAMSQAGDIIVLELQTVDLLPIESELITGNVIRGRVHNKRIVIEAAGNGGANLDSDSRLANWRVQGDTGAILVGAGCAGQGHRKLGFSNFGRRVDGQGWGQDVWTLGNAIASDGTPIGNNFKLNGDENQTYTDGFSGTSSATPIVAAAAAAVQSYSKQQFGCPLKGRQMRSLLRESGILPDNLDAIGPIPDVDAALDLLETWAGLDCNANGISDVCDMWNNPSDSSLDCNRNGRLDACEGLPDCNNNGQLDVCEIFTTQSKDCDENGILDVCEKFKDCNANGTRDVCDIRGGTADCNRNWIPDSCEAGMFPMQGPQHIPGGEFKKNRYISFIPQNAGTKTALEVAIWDGSTLRFAWVGPPQIISHAGGVSNPAQAPGYPTFKAARLQCSAYYHNWGAEGAIHVYGPEVSPQRTFYVTAFCYECGGSVQTLELHTAKWGDVTGGWNGSVWLPPNGIVNDDDVSAIVERFQSLPTAPPKFVADLSGDVLNHLVDFEDISMAVNAKDGGGYPFAGGGDPCGRCPLGQ